MQAEPLVRSDGPARKDQLATASEQLGEVLEDIDLTNERMLADAVLEAVKATDRAYRLASNQ